MTMGWVDRHFVTGGSIIGREHVRLHKNNQDGLAISKTSGLIVGVVTDGCSAGRCSEVGARLAAAWLAAWVPTYWRRGFGDNDAGRVHAVIDGLLDYLRQVGNSLGPDRLEETVGDYLLFTLLVAVVDQRTTCIFGVGDGVWSVNCRRSVIDPGPENAPAYLAYRLLDHHDYPYPERLEPTLYLRTPTEEVRSLIIGTDGLADLGRGGLNPFSWNKRYIDNPMQLQRRLVVLGEHRRMLPDDTSMVLIRQTPRSEQWRS